MLIVPNALSLAAILPTRAFSIAALLPNRDRVFRETITAALDANGSERLDGRGQPSILTPQLSNQRQ